MRALYCRQWCEFKELKIEDVPRPEMRPGCVRVRVAYAGLGFAISLVVAGKYQRKPPLPFVPGTEVTGTVMEVGAGVTRFKRGDRVLAILDWGGFADEALTTEETVYPLPANLDLRSTTHLGISYATVYGALIWQARLQAGETLLVHGAAGGVGLAAIEIGKLLGARVIACASSEDKRATAKAHGADLVLASSDFRQPVKDFTSGRGANVIFDPVGGEVFEESLRCIATEGRIIPIGFAGGRAAQIPANILLVKNIAALGFNFGTYVGWGLTDERKLYAPRVQAMMRELFTWASEGKLHPTVSHCFELEQYVEAMDVVLARGSTGKVALKLNGDPA